ncbi:presqualene diphosphate synthase HpnD [Skermania sp. ID1734]|uniref:presqualene diphosphate synthase HpnD n=1 Tax=Skermania sp. ID1734 TaxID=2597516 RepID=UPI00117EC726|nr:presqualene diphosphate synthase HpnD [Skermania sp. ID1734]TSE00327.1 presqualene diphosphate synthase HpnD [Skermania sp. ID1734]
MSIIDSSEIGPAYVECERITREQAKNFFYGIRLLPPPKRGALSAVYALARRIDDIGDGDLPAARKVAELERTRKALQQLVDNSDPVLAAVGDAARRFPIPLSAFDELIDGVSMDVTGATYEDFPQLVRYCRCVAGSIGRLCLAIFSGTSDPTAATYADQLGIALQQTNILRDVREDLSNGRIYLPRAELAQYGVDLMLDPDGNLADPNARLAALLRHATARAEDWYCLGLRLLPLLDRRSAACCAAMAGIYRHLNRRIGSNPVLVYDRRLSLSAWEKSRVAARALAGGSA